MVRDLPAVDPSHALGLQHALIKFALITLLIIVGKLDVMVVGQAISHHQIVGSVPGVVPGGRPEARGHVHAKGQRPKPDRRPGWALLGKLPGPGQGQDQQEEAYGQGGQDLGNKDDLKVAKGEVVGRGKLEADEEGPQKTDGQQQAAKGPGAQAVQAIEAESPAPKQGLRSGPGHSGHKTQGEKEGVGRDRRINIIRLPRDRPGALA